MTIINDFRIIRKEINEKSGFMKGVVDNTPYEINYLVSEDGFVFKFDGTLCKNQLCKIKDNLLTEYAAKFQK